jgi:DNA-directed RNA polymerase specialized sigma24 family protein
MNAVMPPFLFESPMVDASLPTTSQTLLGRLRRDPLNDAAWDEFVEHYGRHIYRWCRQWKLQDADAEDVAQDILLKLARKLRDFTYDPSSSFRGWLKTVAHHTWLDFVDGQRRTHAVSNDQIMGLLQSVQVRLRVAPHTWNAFQLVALEGMPATEVAAKVQMQVAMVYVAKSKVQKMLQEEIQKLEANELSSH